MFAKAIADISVNDTLFFTPKQLFYLLYKRRPEIYNELYTIPVYLFINIALGIFAFIWTLALSSEWNIDFILVMFVINSLLIAGTFTASRSSKSVQTTPEICKKFANLGRNSSGIWNWCDSVIKFLSAVFS